MANLLLLPWAKFSFFFHANFLLLFCHGIFAFIDMVFFTFCLPWQFFIHFTWQSYIYCHAKLFNIHGIIFLSIFAMAIFTFVEL